MITGVTADIWSDPPRSYKFWPEPDRSSADKPLISVRCFLYPTDQTPMTIRLKAGESPICLVVGGSTASHGHHMGVWQVRGRWVIGISGRCSAQSVGKPPLAGKFHRSKRPMTNFKPVELLSSDDFAWSELVGLSGHSWNTCGGLGGTHLWMTGN